MYKNIYKCSIYATKQYRNKKNKGSDEGIIDGTH